MTIKMSWLWLLLMAPKDFNRKFKMRKGKSRYVPKALFILIFTMYPPSLVTLNQYLAVGTNLTAYLCLPAEVTSFASCAALLFSLLPCTVVTVFVKCTAAGKTDSTVINFKISGIL